MLVLKKLYDYHDAVVHTNHTCKLKDTLIWINISVKNYVTYDRLMLRLHLFCAVGLLELSNYHYMRNGLPVA